MNSRLTIALLTLIAAVEITLAAKGVDVSQAVSVDTWKCIKARGHTFGIVRVYRSNGKIDPNGANTIKNARAAGIRYVDGYIFPCKKCGNPKGQIRATVNHLKDKGAKIGQLWLDVEGRQYWSNDKGDNVKFIKDLVQEARALGVKVAMYTSKSQWVPIAGASTAFKDLQLWYAHYDKKPNFDDFKPFGGWQKPTIKQYAGTTALCGVGVDLNWYP